MFALPGMKLAGWSFRAKAIWWKEPWPRWSSSPTRFFRLTKSPSSSPEIFRRGESFLRDYKARIADLRDIAIHALGDASFVHPRGGFYITLKINGDENARAMRLLQESGILVHPGYYYDVEEDHLVMTFIHERDVIERSFQIWIG